MLETLHEGDAAANGSRYPSYRTSVSPAWLHRTWIFFTVSAALGAVASAAVILIILCRRRLRRQKFNQYIIGVVLPDFLFGFLCALQCFSQALYGGYLGGEATCVLQHVYLTYGISTVFWMNVVVTYELYLMTVAPKWRKTYRPRSTATIVKTVLSVHVACLLFAASVLLPGLPADVGKLKGLYCILLPYDVPSDVFFYAYFFLGIAILPLNIILWYFGRTFYWVYCGGMGKTADRALLSFYFRLCICLVVMHTPSIAPVLFGLDDTILILAGIWSHLQGFITGTLYLVKPDIYVEVKEILFGEPMRTIVSSSFCNSEDVQESISASFEPTRSIEECESSSLVSMSLAERALTDILAQESFPMLVIEFSTWLSLGHFPRSHEGVTRERKDKGDTVVFVSHRWWGDDCPDDDNHTKYASITQAVHCLLKKHHLDSSKVVLWVDWACIDQDDSDKLGAGVKSLISYTARADFVIIPVQLEDDAVKHFRTAMHPADLNNYGERAWCRLEVYTFMCVAEMLERVPYCYAFCPARTMCSCFGKTQLKPLFTSSGASFDVLNLPSSGELTVDQDRPLIQQIEMDMHERYVCHAINAEVANFSRRRLSVVNLSRKQISCIDIGLLSVTLQDHRVARKLQTLNLQGNLIACDGVGSLMQDLVCHASTSVLKELNLSSNPYIESKGIEAIGQGLAHANCCLTRLHLSFCKLDGKSVSSLANYVPISHSLSYLNLSNNSIDDDVGVALFTSCGGSTAPVVFLDLEENPISVDLFIKLSLSHRALQLGDSQRHQNISSSVLPIGVSSVPYLANGDFDINVDVIDPTQQYSEKITAVPCQDRNQMPELRGTTRDSHAFHTTFGGLGHKFSL